MRVGIIGFGGAGQAHVRYFGAVPGVRVTKIFDPEPEGRARAGAVAGVEICSALEAFWHDLDAVSVCSPDRTHASYVVEALDRGLHVLCEKPLTDSAEGVRQIGAAVQRAAGTLAVSHQMRFVPVHQRMKEAVESGELGTVFYLEGTYVHDLRSRAFVNHPWRATDSATPLVYCGSHFVDLLRWIAADEVNEVFAAANHMAFPEYPESDLNLLVMRFRGGAIGKVLVAFGSGGVQDHAVRLHGTAAAVDNNVLFKRGGWGRVLHEPTILQEPLLPRDGARGLDTRLGQVRKNLPAWLLGRSFSALRWLARRPNAEYGGRHYPVRVYEHSLACVSAIEDFVAAARTGRQPLCGFEEAARTVLVCLAGVESYRTNRAVKVQPLETVLN